MLLVTVATVAIFGIPLAFVLQRVLRDDAHSRLEHDATRVANELNTPGMSKEPTADLLTQLRHYVPPEDVVAIQFADGHQVSTGAMTHSLQATVPGPGGTAVTLASPVSEVNSQVERSLVVIIGLAAVAAGAALLLALVQSKRLADPLYRLSRSAARLGDGDFSLATPRSGITEVDGIAIALDQSAERIDRLLRAERSFSTNASHQLRSAITGLELRLEELAEHPDPVVKQEAVAALDQTHRLTETVEELLALARTGRAGIVTNFDLADLVHKHAADAMVELERSGRRLVVDAPAPVHVVAAVGAIGQVVDILLSNATRHGQGTVSVRVYLDERHAIVDVGDQGPGLARNATIESLREEPSRGGHGIGLALARTLVIAEGGTISVARTSPPLFRFELPRA
jgi:signal transduction histidine kinase